jgi:hypothetical protein
VDACRKGIRDSSQKNETSSRENVKVDSYGGKSYVLGLRKTAYPQKNSFNKKIYCIYVNVNISTR